MTPQELLTSREVAARLGVVQSTVNRLVSGGELMPSMKLPGRTGAYLFDPFEVDALVASRTANHSKEVAS